MARAHARASAPAAWLVQPDDGSGEREGSEQEPFARAGVQVGEAREASHASEKRAKPIMAARAEAMATM